MSKKPYMFEHQEWLEIANKKDWINDETNPDDLAEYSELQRPYAQPEDEDTYQGWEWTWPDIDFPDIPPIITPDPIEGDPCSEEGHCSLAKVFGPDSIQCDDCATYSHLHVWIDCGPAPYWAAFGSWFLNTNSADCTLDAGLVTATLCCPEDATGEVEVCWSGSGCYDCKKVVVDCEICCEEPTISGPTTTTKPGSVNFTVSNACPNATAACDGECTDITVALNDAGTTITATLGESACGSFRVSLTNAEGCEAFTVYSEFCRITNSGGFDIDTIEDACNPANGSCPGSICNGLLVKNCVSGKVCYQYVLYCSGVAGQCEGAPCQPPCYKSWDCTGSQKVCWHHYDTMLWNCDGSDGVCGW